MAEFIIAFMAGVGVGYFVLAVVAAWDDRTYITHEFKRRVGGDPAPELYGHVHVSAPLTGMSSNYAPAAMPTTMGNVSNVSWSYEDFDVPNPTPPDPDEFNDPIPEMEDALWADEAGRGYDPDAPDEFNDTDAERAAIADALRAALAAPSPAPVDPMSSNWRTRDSAPLGPPLEFKPGPMEDALSGFMDPDRFNDGPPIDPPDMDPPHIPDPPTLPDIPAAMDALAASPPPMDDTTYGAALEAALREGASHAPMDT